MAGGGDRLTVLLELGADPLATDGSGYIAAAYATSPEIDRPAMEAIHAMTRAELVSAERGQRRPRCRPIDLLAALALGERETAGRLVREDPGLLDPGGGTLHLMAKRNDHAAIRWLLDHGADPNARDAAGLTPLDQAALDSLMPLVYGELRRLASSYLRRERAEHTLQPTALVHEVYLQLAGTQGPEWRGRGPFFALLSRIMRNVLVDYARTRAAAKRGRERPNRRAFTAAPPPAPPWAAAAGDRRVPWTSAPRAIPAAGRWPPAWVRR